MKGVPHEAWRVELRTRPTYWYCEPGWEWQSRPLADHLFWYVIDGVGTMRLEDVAWDLESGSCFVFPPDSQPHGTQDPDRRLVVFGMHFVALAPDGAELPRGASIAPPPGIVVRDKAFFGTLAQRCDVSYRRGDALGTMQSAVWLQAMILHLWDEVAHPTPTAVDLVLDEIVRDLQMEPGKRWAVEDLAARAHLSRAQFVRRFRAATGLSPTRFMIQARLERARRLIQETSMTMSQIADVLGYEDVFFFSRQYKHYAGYPPSDLRRS
jgi:AraC family transcriptional regulator, arabinose operon regulatory protein